MTYILTKKWWLSLRWKNLMKRNLGENKNHYFDVGERQYYFEPKVSMSFTHPILINSQHHTHTKSCHFTSYTFSQLFTHFFFGQHGRLYFPKRMSATSPISTSSSPIDLASPLCEEAELILFSLNVSELETALTNRAVKSKAVCLLEQSLEPGLPCKTQSH